LGAIYVENYYISMKKLIFKKFLGDVLIFFLIFSLSLTLIIWVIQAVNFLDFVTEDGHSLSIYTNYTLLNIPKTFSRILPFVLFISLFYIISTYEKNNELLIFWTNGIAKNEFINAIIKFIFFFVAAQILLTTIIVPKTQDVARSFIRQSNIDFLPSLIKEKKFVDTVKNLTIFVEKKTKNKFYEKVFIKESRAGGDYQIIFAENGEIDKLNNSFILFNGQILTRTDRKENNFTFQKTVFSLDGYTTKTTTTPKIQEWDTLKLIKCLTEIINFNKSYEIRCSKNNIDDYLKEFYRRILTPLFIPSIALVASMLITTSKDSYYFIYFKYLLLALGFFIIILSELSVRLMSFDFSKLIFLLILPLITYFMIYFKFKKKIK
jgi:lipopolysaccharide export system permease protein